MSHKYHNMTKDVNKILFTNKKVTEKHFTDTDIVYLRTIIFFKLFITVCTGILSNETEYFCINLVLFDNGES